MDLPFDRRRLRWLAERATPGPYDGPMVGCQAGSDVERLFVAAPKPADTPPLAGGTDTWGVLSTGLVEDPRSQRDGEYFAALPPAVVLALLDVVDAAIPFVHHGEGCITTPACGACSWCNLIAAVAHLDALGKR